MSNGEPRNTSPWMWIVLVAALAGGYYVYRTYFLNTNPASPERLSQSVPIRCAETGFEWTLNRGRMELYLYEKAALGQLDASQGLENPKTGKRTGFPVDRADWDSTLARILEESKAAAAKMGRGS